MYQIYADQYLLWSSNLGDREFHIGSPKWKQEMGKVHTLSFTIPPTHPAYGALQRMKTIIWMKKDDEVVFRGRILDWETDMRKNKKVTCEDSLAYLNDTWIDELSETEESITSFFIRCIQRHNEMCSQERILEMGTIDIEERNDTKKFKIDSPSNIMDTITSTLVDKYGGFLKVRYTGERTYIDWVEDYDIECDQTIEFGKNLIDLTDKVSGDDIFSILIPTGKDDLTIKDTITSGTETLSTGVEIETVAGEPYIKIPDAIDKYGWIYRIESDTEDEDGDAVYESGKEFIENNYLAYPSTLTIKAIDMHMMGVETDALKLGAKVRIVSEPHDLDMDYQLKSIDEDLQHPENTSYDFGDPDAESVNTTSSSTASNIASKTSSAVATVVQGINLVNSRIDMTNSSIAMINSTISMINGYLEVINSSVSVISSSIAIVDSKIEAVESSIRLVESTIGMIDSYVYMENGTISMLRSKLESIDSTIDMINSSVGIMESTIESYGSSISVMWSTIGMIDSYVYMENGTISLLRSKLEAIDSTISMIDSYVYIDQGTISILRSWMTSTDSSIELLNATITMVDSYANMIGSSIEAINSSVTLIDSYANMVGSSVEVINASISAIDSYVFIGEGSTISILRSSLSIIDGRLEGLETIVANKVDANGVLTVIAQASAISTGSLTSSGSVTATQLSAQYIYMNGTNLGTAVASVTGEAGSGDEYTITVTKLDGTTNTITFNSAASALTYSGIWSGASYTVTASDGSSTTTVANTSIARDWSGTTLNIISGSSTLLTEAFTSGAGTGNQSAGTQVSISSFNSSHKAYGYVNATSHPAGRLYTFNVDASGVYSSGESAGYQAGVADVGVRLEPSNNRVVPSTSGVAYLGVSASATYTYSSSSHFYTITPKATVGSTPINGTALQIGTECYWDGVNSVGVTFVSADKQVVPSRSGVSYLGISASATQTYDSSTHRYTVTPKAYVGSTPVDGTALLVGDAAYSDGITAGVAQVGVRLEPSNNRVVPSTSGVAYLGVSASATYTYSSSSHFYTITPKATVGSTPINGTALQIGTECYWDGVNSVGVYFDTSNNQVIPSRSGVSYLGVAASATQTYDSSTHRYTVTPKATVGSTPITGTNLIVGDAAYSDGIAAVGVTFSTTNNRVTPSTSGTPYLGVSASATQTYNSSTHRYTVTPKATVGSTPITGTAVIVGDAAYSDGIAAVGVTFSSSNNRVTPSTSGVSYLAVSASATQTYDSSSHLYTITPKAYVGSSPVEGTAFTVGTDAYNAGKNAVGLSTVTVSNMVRTGNSYLVYVNITLNNGKSYSGQYAGAYTP